MSAPSEPQKAGLYVEAGPAAALPCPGRAPRRRGSRTARALQTVLFIALRQLWARKLLNTIAVLGVTIGVFVLVALSGVMNGMSSRFLATMQQATPHVAIHETELHPQAPLLARFTGEFVATEVAHDVPADRSGRLKRPFDLVRALDSMPGVERAAASLSGPVLLAFGGKSKSIELRGIDVASQDKVTPISRYVVAGELDELERAPDGVAIGSGVAERLGVIVGDVVHAATPDGTPLDLRVVAIYESGVTPLDRTRGYALLHNVQALLGRPDAIGQIEVRLTDSDDAERMTAHIENLFGYDAESWQEANASFIAVFRQNHTVVGLVIAATLLLGGFGILAIQIMIVLEKTRDIAILRSVGLRRKDILGIFLMQGALIALIGGLLGAVLGKIAIVELAKLKVEGNPLLKTSTFLVTDDPMYYVEGIVFALVVGVVASFIPAWRGARVEPVDVLRGQIG